MRHISFTTDYGLTDAFVAICHGVALRAAPGVRIVDVTHLVPLGDVRRGATVLADAVPYLPEGSVHVAVVDPGVGTSRRAIALETPGGFLVGPDNGLLVPAAEALGGVTSAVELVGDPEARTFHGRDLFMPAAARLAAGGGLDGLTIDPGTVVRLPGAVTRSGPGWLEAEVRGVDGFGSLQLAVGASAVEALGPLLEVRGHRVPRGATFGDVPAGDLLVLVDSMGYAAISVNRGSAAERLGIGAGEVVRLERWRAPEA